MAQLPPTTPSQRSGLEPYNDLTELIRVGFIATDVVVGRVHLSVRNLLPWDRKILNRRISLNGSDRNFKIWALAQCTWMVDGHVILSDTRMQSELYRTYSQLSSAHINKLFGAFLQCRFKFFRAFDALESFMFESTSRSLWVESKSVGINSVGFRGFDAPLGLNEIQRSWTLYNYYEDLKISQEHEWSIAKLIASSNAPKGVEKLNASDKSRKEQEDNRRQELQDRFYYKTMGLITDDGTPTQDIPKLVGGSSPEELEDEMRRWILGEKDDHDIIVENYKRHVSENFARQLRLKEEQVEEARKTAQKAQEDEGAIQLVGFTLNELRDRLEKEGYDPHVSTAHFQSKGREYLYRRYLEKAPSTGDSLCE